MTDITSLIADLRAEGKTWRDEVGEMPLFDRAADALEALRVSLADAWDAGVDAANGAALSDVDIMPNPYREYTERSSGEETRP